MAKYVREHYPRSEDEELVCIAENNSCSVDAVQELLGCTFGKGNLIYKDNGKQVFTFFSRSDGRAMRIYFKGDLSGSMDDLRARYFKGDLSEEEKKEFETMRSQVTEHIIDAPHEELLSVSEVEIPCTRESSNLSFTQMRGVQRGLHGDLRQNCEWKNGLQGMLPEDGRLGDRPGKRPCKSCRFARGQTVGSSWKAATNMPSPIVRASVVPRCSRRFAIF